MPGISSGWGSKSGAPGVPQPNTAGSSPEKQPSPMTGTASNSPHCFMLSDDLQPAESQSFWHLAGHWLCETCRGVWSVTSCERLMGTLIRPDHIILMVQPEQV